MPAPAQLGQTQGYLAAMLSAVGSVEQLQEWIVQRATPYRRRE
ncbi:hypothetical protein O7623_19360 [Solwaraspora sp. WMMD791]|nr:hypothetical protein [Solwaraspora sp. WMMD791]WFE25541.1 hypothetical protein O7623_19360 [Solwaraspora sp. WMMD791]